MVAPIQWKRVGGASAPEMAPSSARMQEAASNSAGDVAGLEAKIRQLESSMASRESQARQQGLAQGRAEAEKELGAPLQEAAARMAAQIAELAGIRPRLRREAEEDLVKLAVAIARRVLRRELTADPEAILGIAKAALEKLNSREIMQIRVHPKDADLIRQALQARGMPPRVEVVADHGLERSALVVETKRGNLDASVETQLAEIERGFTDLVRQRSS